MYPHVITWLRKYMLSKFRNAQVIVDNTSNKVLSRWLQDNNLHIYFRDYQTYEVEVDVTGVATTRKSAQIILIECKLKEIKLRDVSQLLGYSKVVRPYLSIILSPKGLSRSLHHLLNIFRRYDLLEYGSNKYIIIGRWDPLRAEPDVSSLIPRGIQL